MLDKGLLISGNDIPFPLGQINIRQPKVKDILTIGEKNFFQGCELITFSKDILQDKDKTLLSNRTNFEILMSIINDKSKQTQMAQENFFNILLLLFPDYQISFHSNYIMLIKEGEMPHSINNENYEEFKLYIKDIFNLNKKKDDEKDYNPGGDKARELADRFKKRRAKLAKDKGEEDVSLFDKYLSILSVGLQMDINVLLNYTLYQLYDVFERYNLKESYDIGIQARMAGAKSESLDKIEHWMKNIHS